MLLLISIYLITSDFFYVSHLVFSWVIIYLFCLIGIKIIETTRNITVCYKSKNVWIFVFIFAHWNLITLSRRPSQRESLETVGELCCFLATMVFICNFLEPSDGTLNNLVPTRLSTKRCQINCLSNNSCMIETCLNWLH